MTGRFIVLEGADGVGKTTQLKAVVHALRDAGVAVIGTRQPGGTIVADKLREVLLHNEEDEEPISPYADLLAFAAARAQLVDTIIRPALDAGTHVVCDRGVTSSMVFQPTVANGLYGASLVESVNRIAMHGTVPDLEIVLDITDAEREVRFAKRGQAADRMESLTRSLDLAQRFRDPQLHRTWPWRVVDASAPAENVTRTLLQVLRTELDV